MDWEQVRPILNTTYALLANEEGVREQELCEALGCQQDDEHMGRIFQRLNDAGYIKGTFSWQGQVPVLVSATEKGLQETSGWPTPDSAGSDQVDLLLRVLDEQIASDEIPDEEKTKLRRIRDGVGSASRDVFVGVLTAYAKQATGG